MTTSNANRVTREQSALDARRGVSVLSQEPHCTKYSAHSCRLWSSGAEQLHASSYKRHPAASCSASSAARTLPLRARARTTVFLYFQQRPRSTAMRRLSKPASTVKYCLWLMGLRHGQAGLASALSAWRARASGAGLEAAATTAKRNTFVNTCNYLLSWRCRKVRSSGRVMQQHSCSRSQRASSTSFCASCSARRASPPAPARPSSPSQPHSRSRSSSTRAHAAAVTRGTSAARNDGSTSVHGELDAAHQRLYSPPG